MQVAELHIGDPHNLSGSENKAKAISAKLFEVQSSITGHSQTCDKAIPLIINQSLINHQSIIKKTSINQLSSNHQSIINQSIINQSSINHQSIINQSSIILGVTDRRTQTMTTTDNNNRQTTDRHSCRGLPFGDGLITIYLVRNYLQKLFSISKNMVYWRDGSAQRAY